MGRNMTISESVLAMVAAAGFRVAMETVSRQPDGQGDKIALGEAPILIPVDLDKIQAAGIDVCALMNGQGTRVPCQSIMREGIRKGWDADTIVTRELNRLKGIRAASTPTVVERKVYLGPEGEEYATKDEALEAWANA